MRLDYDYGDVLTASQRINWRIEDIIGDGKELDFDKPFLPESLAQVGRLPFLDDYEQLALNHIRATHPNFLATVGSLTPSGKARLEEAAPVFT